MAGYIKLYRELKNWRYYKKSQYVHFFIYCLLRANHQDNYFEDKLIKRGSFVSSLKNMSEETGLSVQTIRTILKRLAPQKSTQEITHELTSESTTKYSIISIVNYDKYQATNTDINTQSNKQLTNEQQTTNKRLTTINNVKNDKKVKNEKNIYNYTFITKDNFKWDYSMTVDQIWNAYPNVTGKGNKKKYNEKIKKVLIKDKVSPQTILDAIEKYKNQLQQNGYNNKHLVTWLNQEGWNDEYEVEKKFTNDPSKQNYDLNYQH